MNEMPEEMLETVEKELKERRLQINMALKGYTEIPDKLKEEWEKNLKNIEKVLRWIKRKGINKNEL